MNNTIIFVFVGRAMKFGIDTTEFQKTLNNIGYEKIVFFRDITKSWYNNGDSYESIQKNITKVLENNFSDNVIFMGSSMGGFGSILFSSIYDRCNSVIAFSPQIQIDPKLVRGWDDRYTKDLKHVEKFLYPRVDHLIKDTIDYQIVIGDQKEDKEQAKLISHHPNVKLTKVHGADHNVPKTLKVRGILDTFLKERIDESIRNRNRW